MKRVKVTYGPRQPASGLILKEFANKDLAAVDAAKHARTVNGGAEGDRTLDLRIANGIFGLFDLR
jgi:hypothetical protein